MDLQGGAVVARYAHNVEVVCSIHTPAIFWFDGFGKLLKIIRCKHR